MGLSRREFVELVMGGLSGCGLCGLAACGSNGHVKPITLALAEKRQTKEGNLPVIWIQASSCAGCSVSTLNTVHPDIAELLTQVISLEFHPNVMASAGPLALSLLDSALAAKRRGKFVLVVEGAVATAHGGQFSTMGELRGKPVTTASWVRQLARNAKAVIAVGTCASFGGIPAAKPNPTGAKPVSALAGRTPLINVPGCSVHPDWLVGTVAHVLLYGLPALDRHRRPRLFYGRHVHDRCTRRGFFERQKFARTFGEEGCMLRLGCKGQVTGCDSPVRRWNDGAGWCVESGSPCLGCTEPTFPEHGGAGLYGQLPSAPLAEKGGTP